MAFSMLHKKIQKLLSEKGFVSETSAQKKAIKEILDGKNVLLVAPTGTGKTEAVFLPILDKMVRKEPDRIEALYITPLRSLNRDLLRRLTYWGNSLEIDIEIRHGDTSQRIRSQQASDPPHILITTPETLQSLMVGKKIKEHLKNVKYVIVDEIHELFGSKRGVQLSVALERLKRLTKRDFIRIGLSATIGDRGKIGAFLKGSSKKVDIIEVEKTRKVKISVEWPEVEEGDFANSERIYASPEAYSKIRRIIEIFEARKSSIIFINTRVGAEILSSRLKSLEKEINVHHSSLSKDSRIKTENSLKENVIPAVVSTSSLALGIDIGHIDTVIQYMSPRRVELFLQKVGRSGHSIEKTPEGFIIVVDEDDAIESAVVGKRSLAGELEPVIEKRNCYDVLAHQLSGLAFEKDVSIEEAFSLVKKAEPYWDLEETEFKEVLTTMQTLGVIRVVDGVIRQGRNVYNYYFPNLSMIPDSKNYDVVNFATKEKIATIDQNFVTDLDIGDNFICRGSAWTVVSKEDKILVEPSASAFNAPEWSGELMPVDFNLAQEVGLVKKEIYLRKGKALEWLTSNYPVDKKAGEMIVGDVQNLKTQPGPEKIVIESFRDYVVLHAYFGNKVNETLAKLIASFLVLKYGKDVGVRSDQYRIIFKLPEKRKAELVKEILGSIAPEMMEKSLRVVLKDSTMFKQRFLQVSKRMGIVSRGANITKLGMKKLIEIYAGSVVFEEAIKDTFDEKLDVTGTKKVISLIKQGEIGVELSPGWSNFSERFVKSYAPEIVAPERPESEILRLIARRLENKRIGVACLYCKKWDGSFLVKNADVLCPNCKSRLIGKVYPEDLAALKAKKPTEAEKKRIAKVRKSADLYLSYGKNAFLVLAGHGIGPETGKRILHKFDSYEDLIKRVVEAEKSYSKTRMFWDEKLREHRL